jgi:site-specific recombinase XerD
MFIQEHPKSVFTRMRRYSVDFSETFGSYKVEELSSSLLKMWFDQIKQENNLLDITMRGIKSDIDVFFKYLINKEIISESPLKAIYYKKTVPEISARNILSPKLIEGLLEEIKEFSPWIFIPHNKTSDRNSYKAK